MSASTLRVGRSVATTSLLAGLLSIGIVAAGHAQQPTPEPAKPVAVAAQPVATPAQPAIVDPEETARATLRSETRIRRLHDRLGITPAEEALWSPVAQAMRDNEKAFRTDLAEKTHGIKTPTALDDLKTFEVIADHHANGLKKFIPPFETLYKSLSPAQQKIADRAFRERLRSESL